MTDVIGLNTCHCCGAVIPPDTTDRTCSACREKLDQGTRLIAARLACGILNDDVAALTAERERLQKTVIALTAVGVQQKDDNATLRQLIRDLTTALEPFAAFGKVLPTMYHAYPDAVVRVIEPFMGGTRINLFSGVPLYHVCKPSPTVGQFLAAKDILSRAREVLGGEEKENTTQENSNGGRP